MFLASIGFLTVIVFEFSFLSLVYRIFIPGINVPSFSTLLTIQINRFRKGDRPAYAIVTGPTSGIGKSYAMALAKKGFNLILVSRSKEKLESLESEIKVKAPNIDMRLVDVDMAEYPLGRKYAETLKDVALNRGDIRVLINNAGRSHDMPVTFEDTNEEEMEGIVGVNTGGVLRATKEALPYLLSDSYSPLKTPLIIGRRRD